jgi:prophage regulatory protein
MIAAYSRQPMLRNERRDDEAMKNLIPYRDLKAKGVPFSKPHLWRLEKAGKFPKRVPISASRYAYVEEEIDAFVDALIAARDAKAAAA